MLGEEGVGKSCLSIQMCHNYFTKEYDPTIENSYRTQVTVDGEAIMLQLLDTAGQEEYIAMIDQHIGAGDGFMLVYSITSRQSFEGLARFVERIVRVKEVDNFPIVIIGNKCDLEKDRNVSTQEGKEYGKSIGRPAFETSAKSRFNVEESYHQLVREVNKWSTRGRDGTLSGNRSNNNGIPSSPETSRKKNKKCIII